MNNWIAGKVDDGGRRGILYDARVIANLENGGGLAVCDTFVEFMPLLVEAKELRDLSENLLIHISMGWEYEEIALQLKAAIERTRAKQEATNND